MNLEAMLLSWQGEKKIQVWYDAKFGGWTAAGKHPKKWLQFTKPALIDVLIHIKSQWEILDAQN